MCTHLSRFWLSPGHAHTPHTRPRAAGVHALPYQLPRGKTAKCRHFQLRCRRRRRASSLSGSKTQQLNQPTSCLPPSLPSPLWTTLQTGDSNFIDGNSGRLKACYTFVTAAKCTDCCCCCCWLLVAICCTTTAAKAGHQQQQQHFHWRLRLIITTTTTTTNGNHNA